MLKISLDEINKRSEPYQLFTDSIKSPETFRRYRNHLQAFLELVPEKLYKDTLGKVPKKKEHATFANIFVELAKKNPELASNVIATFIKNKRKLVEEEKRIIWKKLQEAKRNGRTLDISELGESKGLSWKNLYSDKSEK